MPNNRRVRSLLVTLCFGVALQLAGCSSAAPAAAPPQPAPTATVFVAPTPSLVPPTSTVPPTATPQPSATAAPSSKSVWVGNTDGQGVFLRRTPALADRLPLAYPDGTPLNVISDDVDSDGQHWHHVRAPDGREGYVPVVYAIAFEPTRVVAPTAPQAIPTATAPPSRPTAVPTPPPTSPPQSTCGAPSNPWAFNFCGRGSAVRAAPPNFCSYFDCIVSFWNSTNGYVAQCGDGMFSHSGGVRGACSGHGGVGRALNAP